MQQKKMDEKKKSKNFLIFFCEIIFSKGNLFLNVLLHFETILSKKNVPEWGWRGLCKSSLGNYQKVSPHSTPNGSERVLTQKIVGVVIF